MRVVSWICAGFTALTLLGALALVLLFNNPGFHSYLIRQVEANASKSLGVPVHLENFAIHLPTMSADLYGVTVAGAGPYPDPPLLEVDHIEAGVRVVSILHRAWYFDNLRIDRPIVHIYVDEHGVSNIPTIKNSSNSNNTSIFDLGIRHALLDRGEVYYNNRPSALDVDMRDVQFRAAFNSLLQQYSGNLTYSDGHLAYGTFRPLTHNLETQFQATPNTFDLTHCKLTIGPSQAVLSGTLHNYTQPNAQAHYDVTVDGSQVAALLRNPSIPAGTIQASGNIEYQQVAGRPVLEALAVEGDVASRRLDLKTSSASAQIGNVAAHYSLANGNVTLKSFRANLLGGAVTAQGTMKKFREPKYAIECLIARLVAGGHHARSWTLSRQTQRHCVRVAER